MNNVVDIERFMGSKIFSIFGQIEEVVARAMVSEGKGHIIPTEQFPDARLCPDVWTDEHGRPAKFGVQFSARQVIEFYRRLEALRR